MDSMRAAAAATARRSLGEETAGDGGVLVDAMDYVLYQVTRDWARLGWSSRERDAPEWGEGVPGLGAGVPGRCLGSVEAVLSHGTAPTRPVLRAGRSVSPPSPVSGRPSPPRKVLYVLLEDHSPHVSGAAAVYLLAVVQHCRGHPLLGPYLPDIQTAFIRKLTVK